MNEAEFWERTEKIVYRFAFLLVIVIAVVGWFVAGDETGWMPHWRSVDLYYTGEWLSGESKVCSGVQSLTADKGKFPLNGLFCSPDIQTALEPHHIKILFWGSVTRPEISMTDELSRKKNSWRCERHSGDNFVCYAIN